MGHIPVCILVLFSQKIFNPTPGDEALKQALKTADKNVKKEYYEKYRKNYFRKIKNTNGTY